MERKHLWFPAGVFVSGIIAILLSSGLGHPVLFWFISGAIIGLSGELFLVPREKWKAFRFALAIILSGIAYAAAAGILEIAWP
jgi:hypothetical protein